MTKSMPLFIVDENTPNFILMETIRSFLSEHDFKEFAITDDGKTYNVVSKLDYFEIPLDIQPLTLESIFDFPSIIIIPPAEAIQDFSPQGLIFDTTYSSPIIDAMSLIHENINALKNDIEFAVILPPELGMIPYAGSYIRMIVTKRLFNAKDNINHEQREHLAHATIAASIVNFELEYEKAEEEYHNIFGDMNFDINKLHGYIKELCKDRPFTPTNQKKIDAILGNIE